MTLTVLIPVYRGVDDVRACVDSVVRDATTSQLEVALLVINDASPEAAVNQWFDALPDELDGIPVRALRNDTNLGFVATVNRGMAATEGDVVWLNADTVVGRGALRAMVRACGPDTATVTPLTTSGSICTIPEDLVTSLGPVVTPTDVDRVADHIGRYSPALHPEVITGVGFAMLVSRAAWDAVGPLDVRAFGTGYGEEVDLCLRASRAGWVHRVADDGFVHHAGGGSFGAEQRRERLASSSRVLHGRYPFFRAANAAEQAREPLAATFAALRLGLTPRDPDRQHVLHLLHSEPGSVGGTESHSEILLAGLADTHDFSLAYPVDGGVVLRTRWVVEGSLVEHEHLVPTAARRAVEPNDPNAALALRTVLDLYDFDAVHIQNLIGWSVGALRALVDFAGPVVLSLRDLYLACPHHWLMYRNEVNCGVPDDLNVCATCLPVTRGLPVEVLTEHRELVTELLPAVDHIVVASLDSLDFLRRVYDVPDEQVTYIEHGAIVPLERRRSELDVDLVMDETLRLGFVGLARKKKGIDLASWLADELADDGVEIHCFGAENEDVGERVITHGSFDNDDLPFLLEAAGIHAGLLVAPYAETFGHAMTEVLLAGRPVIVSEVGALAERTRRDAVGWTVDAEDLPRLATFVRNLDRRRHELLTATSRVTQLPVRHTRDTVAAYAALYGDPEVPTRERSATMNEREDRQRQALRAMSLLNRQLQSAGEKGSNKAGDAAAQSATRELRRTLRSREREIERTNEAFRQARKEKRALARDLESLRNRRSVRLALRLTRLLSRR